VSRIGADSDRCDAASIAEVLVDLADITGCRARVGVLRDDCVSYWEAPPGGEPPAGPSTALSLSADSVAAHLTALGQVLLAAAGDGAAQAVIAREWPSCGPVAQRGRDDMARTLMVTRLSGVAIARTPRPGVSLGVAVPVRGADDRVVAGLELDARDFRQVESVLVDLNAASRRLSGCGTGY